MVGSRTLPVHPWAEIRNQELDARPLIDAAQADELVHLFKMLASDTRLSILHALARAGEPCVMQIAAQLDMVPQTVLNQLQQFVDRRIVAARREGSRLFYRITDPCVTGSLDLALCLLEEPGRLPSQTG